MNRDNTKFKWVVYISKVARTEPGVYKRYVDIVGKAAYVLPLVDGYKADIIPAAYVFEEEKDALACMAGTGVEKWVVTSSGRGEVVVLFRGRVQYFMAKKWGHFDYVKAAVRNSDGKVFSGHGTETFDTLKEAEKHHAKVWKERYKELAEEVNRKTALLVEMLENKPRSRRKK